MQTAMCGECAAHYISKSSCASTVTPSFLMHNCETEFAQVLPSNQFEDGVMSLYYSHRHLGTRLKTKSDMRSSLSDGHT